MPVKYSVTIQHISEDEFYLLDHRVMELVFSIHNNFGRLYDEKIYQNELAYLCQKMGIETATEIPIHVSYKDFIKLYRKKKNRTKIGSDFYGNLMKALIHKAFI